MDRLADDELEEDMAARLLPPLLFQGTVALIDPVRDWEKYGAVKCRTAQFCSATVWDEKGKRSAAPQSFAKVSAQRAGPRGWSFE